MPLQHLSGRVWLYPHDPDPARVQAAVAVISHDDGSVVVDAGHSPQLARDVQRAVTATGLPPARTLVYTHHHWDHVWGGCAWDGVERVAHVSAAPILEAEALRPWSDDYLEQQVRADPRLGPSFRARQAAMPTWDGFTIEPPDRTFCESLQIGDGVTLRHVGGKHAEDSVVVTVPDSGVMLLGDCFYPPPFHLRAAEDSIDGAMAHRLAAEGFDWYVDSHSPPRRLDEVVTILAGGEV